MNSAARLAGLAADGRLGTSARTVPTDGVIGILFMQRIMNSPEAPNVFSGCRTLAYAAMEQGMFANSSQSRYRLVCSLFVFVSRIMRPPRRPAGMKQICNFDFSSYIDNTQLRATASEFNESGDDMPKKKIKRRAWSSADVRKFKSLAKAKTPAPKIARTFKRTEGAIRQKALHLGISLNSRGG